MALRNALQPRPELPQIQHTAKVSTAFVARNLRAAASDNNPPEVTCDFTKTPVHVTATSQKWISRTWFIVCVEGRHLGTPRGNLIQYQNNAMVSQILSNVTHVQVAACPTVVSWSPASVGFGLVWQGRKLRIDEASCVA